VSGARATLTLAAALIAAGLGFDIPSLYEPGVALALLVASTRAWVEIATRPIRLRRLAPRRSVVEDGPLEVELELERGRVPPPGAELRDPLLAAPVAVASRGDPRVGFTARWRRRGRKRLGPTELVVRDPFGLHARAVAAEGEGSVLVLPRLEPIDVEASDGGSLALGLLAGGAAARRGAAPIEIEIDGLRPYRDGSPASRIHWPTVARTGELIERRLDAGAGGRPLVVLDASAPASEEALDRAVRAAASLVQRLALAGGCGLVVPSVARVLEVDSRLNGFDTAHARLALVVVGGRSPAVRGARSHGAAVFWVTGAAPPAASSLRRLGASECFVVSPVGAPAEADFSVAGCAGHRLGSRMTRSTDRARRAA
jgi:uncharacterized protein (DUF58 family)